MIDLCRQRNNGQRWAVLGPKWKGWCRLLRLPGASRALIHIFQILVVSRFLYLHLPFGSSFQALSHWPRPASKDRNWAGRGGWKTSRDSGERAIMPEASNSFLNLFGSIKQKVFAIIQQWLRYQSLWTTKELLVTAIIWVWVKIRYPNNWMVNTKLD